MDLQIFTLIALIVSAVIHEVSHGYAALWLGDETAKQAGRLSFNPIIHLDIVGSVILPLLLFFTNSPFFFAWAKPVPYNPYNLRNRRWGDLIVALSGPLSNILLAIIFYAIIWLVVLFFSNILNMNAIALAIFLLARVMVMINIVLAMFNLLPIPPLDGSKIIVAILPEHWRSGWYKLEPYGLIIVIVLIMSGFINQYFERVIHPIFLWLGLT